MYLKNKHIPYIYSICELNLMKDLFFWHSFKAVAASRHFLVRKSEKGEKLKNSL